MATIADTCMVIAMLEPTDRLRPYAAAEFQTLMGKGPLLVLDIVYAEVAYSMQSQEALDLAIATVGFQRFRPPSPEATDAMLFRAGQAFKAYKDNRGPKPRVLPDMLVGAAAETMSLPLWTDNSSDFLRYFTGLQLISPPPS